MRSLKPIRKREWTRDDAISIGFTLATLGIVLALGKLVAENVTSQQLDPGNLKSTCLGFWGCSPPTPIEIGTTAILILIVALLIGKAVEV